jgi:dipeptidyl aminopeptidase/acylaminoacyl peptidase
VPDSKTIYFTSADEGEEPIFEATLNGTNQTLYRDGGFSDLHLLPNSQTVIAIVVTVKTPGELVTVSKTSLTLAREVTPISSVPDLKVGPGPIKGVDEEPLTHLNDALLAQLDLPKMDSFWFTAADKTKLQGFLIRPPGFDPTKKYPTKLLIHGGPQGAWGDAWSYRWNAELFAANGYVVVMINPRGSTGYGQAIVDGVNGDWGGKPFTDLMQGLDYAEQHYPFIDKTRECALGASYGGYMANWVLGHTDRFQCIVSHDGMFDAESAYGSTEELWFNEWEFKGKPWDYYGKPDAENPFRKWSPAMSAKNFKTPTLVIHGQLDYRLDVSEGFQLFTTLQRLKVPSKMLYFPDEGHWVLKPQNAQLWYKTVNDWVDQWTGTAASSH